MKILRIVLTGEEHPHYTITEAFNKYLTDTIYWDTLPLSGLNHEIQRMIRENDYDLIFMQLQAPNIVTVETARLMSERSTVFNWSGDVRADLSWYIELAPYVITLFTNMTDVRTIQELGFRAEYLQTGYDHNYYFKKQEERSRIVSFCANYYPNAQFPLTPYRVAAVKRLQQLPEFNLYGGNWEQIGIKSKGMLNNVQEAEVYNNSLLAINISHFNYSRYFSDRLLREMACGCCVLSHQFQDCELEFESDWYGDNGHIVYFEDVNDMEEKVKYFLTNPEEAIAIGERAAKYVKKYSWNNFVNNLIDIFKNNTK